MCQLDCTESEYDLMARFCEHGYETLGSQTRRSTSVKWKLNISRKTV